MPKHPMVVCVHPHAPKRERENGDDTRFGPEIGTGGGGAEEGKPRVINAYLHKLGGGADSGDG